MSRREEIIQAARKVALNQGINNVSVRKVGAEAGIGASTLRHYFPTNKELFAAVANSDLRDFVSGEALDDLSLPAADRLATSLAQFLPSSDEHLAQLEQMLAMYQLAFENGKLVGNRAMKATAEQGQTIVESWLEKLRDQGERLLMDPHDGARFALTFVNGLSIDLISQAGDMSVAQMRRRLDAVAHLIIADE